MNCVNVYHKMGIDTWFGVLVGLMDDPVSFWVRLCAMDLLVCVPHGRGDYLLYCLSLFDPPNVVSYIM